MIDRRNFVATAAGSVAAIAASGQVAWSEQVRGWLMPPHHVARAIDVRGNASPDVLAEDEKFWAEVRSAYALNEQVLNLDHGWTNPTPAAALNELTRGLRQLEGLPAEELPRMWYEITNTAVRAKLSEVMGVGPTEIAIVRNATEALDTVLMGIPLRAGDEVVCSAHDYYAMMDALEQRRARAVHRHGRVGGAP